MEINDTAWIHQTLSACLGHGSLLICIHVPTYSARVYRWRRHNSNEIDRRVSSLSYSAQRPSHLTVILYCFNRSFPTLHSICYFHTFSFLIYPCYFHRQICRSSQAISSIPTRIYQILAERYSEITSPSQRVMAYFPQGVHCHWRQRGHWFRYRRPPPST